MTSGPGMPSFYIPQKQNVYCLLLGKKHQLRPVHLKLSLEDSHIEQNHEHQQIGITTDGEFG